MALAGIEIDVGLGLLDLDLPMDLRDISATFTVNFAPWELSWWGTALVNLVALVIGTAKYQEKVQFWMNMVKELD